MRKMTLPILVLGSIVAALLQIAPANAQATRTWISGVGDDVNPCSRTAPCKTFAGAISKTAASGEIDCLDPGGFGVVTIIKAITLDCGAGNPGGILVAGTNGIIVAAGVNDKVVIRNMTLQGNGTGLSGISFTGGLELTVDNVRIQGFTVAGINVNKSASANVYVRNTKITLAPTGIKLFTGAGGLTASIDNTDIDGASASALEVASGSTFASISRSVLAANGNALLTSGGGFINADYNIIAKNTTGVNSNASGGSIRISNNTFVDNGTAITFANGGTVSSAGNNTVVGNPGSNPNAGAIPLK